MNMYIELKEIMSRIVVKEFWGFVVVISFVISEWLRHVILAKDTNNSYGVFAGQI
jgi:hypothetical protein